MDHRKRFRWLRVLLLALLWGGMARAGAPVPIVATPSDDAKSEIFFVKAQDLAKRSEFKLTLGSWLPQNTKTIKIGKLCGDGLAVSNNTITISEGACVGFYSHFLAGSVSRRDDPTLFSFLKEDNTPIQDAQSVTIQRYATQSPDPVQDPSPGKNYRVELIGLTIEEVALFIPGCDKADDKKGTWHHLTATEKKSVDLSDQDLRRKIEMWAEGKCPQRLTFIGQSDATKKTDARWEINSETWRAAFPKKTPSPDASTNNCMAIRERYVIHLPGDSTGALVCIDLQPDASIPLLLYPDTTILRPNTPLTVEVLYPKDAYEQVEIELSGDRGTYYGEIGNHTIPVESGDNGTAESDRVTRRFAPRKPGSVDVRVVLTTDKDHTRTLTPVQFEVVKTYIGAVRLGLGTSLGGAVPRTFSAMLAPGSGQKEITATSGGWFSPELVLGFAPFLWDFKNGGRTALPRADDGGSRWAPYIGVGVVASSPEGQSTFSLLQSVYLGLEWELIPSASIAFGGMIRRVDRLADPFEVGGPATEDPVPTFSSYAPGVMLVVSVSPEFLKVGGGLLKGGN